MIAMNDPINELERNFKRLEKIAEQGFISRGMASYAHQIALMHYRADEVKTSLQFGNYERATESLDLLTSLLLEIEAYYKHDGLIDIAKNIYENCINDIAEYIYKNHNEKIFTIVEIK